MEATEHSSGVFFWKEDSFYCKSGPKRQGSMTICTTRGNPACLLWLLWRGAKPCGELLIAPAGHPGSVWNLRDSSSPWLFAPQVGFAELSALSVWQCGGGLEETLSIFKSSWILPLFVRKRLRWHLTLVCICFVWWLIGVFSNKSICMIEGDFKYSWFLGY